MAASHKPVIWGLFAAGGTLAAFLVPTLILITCFAAPLGWLPEDFLSFDNMQRLLQGMLRRPLFGLILVVILWHAAHRMRITAHDFGIRNDRIVMLCCYGVAAFGTVSAAVALLIA